MPTNLFAAQPDSTGTKIIENLDEKAVSTAELIKQGRFHELLDQFLTFSIDLLGKLLIVFVLFFIGKWIAIMSVIIDQTNLKNKSLALDLGWIVLWR